MALFNLSALLCFNAWDILPFNEMESTAASTSHVNCYATLPFSASYPLGIKRTEIKSDRGETLKLARLSDPLCNHVGYALAPDMTRVRQRSLPAMARARSIAPCSRHISGTQSFQENRHISIHLLIVHNLLVPFIGRLVACSATDRQTERLLNPRCACAPRVDTHNR